MCQYVSRIGKRCPEENFEDTGYCILHAPFPTDENSQEFWRMVDIKQRDFQEKLEQGIVELDGIRVYNLSFRGFMNSGLQIRNSLIYHDVTFQDFKTEKAISIFHSTICGSLHLNKANIPIMDLSTIRVNGVFKLDRSKINLLGLEGDIINALMLAQTKIEGSFHCYSSDFGRVIISNSTFLADVDWINCEFKQPFVFNRSSVEGKHEFTNSKFTVLKVQEECCRRAKVSLEKVGDREKADKYYYREMEAKRRQKEWYKKYPELFLIQIPFAYGIEPYRVIGVWLIFVLVVFPVLYGYGQITNINNIWDLVYFSVVTATTLGFGDSTPITTAAKVIVSIEAIFGTFMWAAFITIFARKYMR